MKYMKLYEEHREDITFENLTFREWLKFNPLDKNAYHIDCHNSNLIDLDGIEEFKNVETLDFSYNSIEEFPENFNLDNLLKFNCSGNEMIKLPDLSKSTNLEILYVNNNGIEELPDISNLVNLRILEAKYNELEEIPDLSKLVNLEYFEISHNYIGEIKGLYYLKKLKKVDLSFNQLPYYDIDGYRKWYENNVEPNIGKTKRYNI